METCNSSVKRDFTTMGGDEDASGRPPPPPPAKAGRGSHRHLAKESKDAYFRNLYTKAPDFKAMAHLDPEFAAVFVVSLPWLEWPC
jgi:23S rRNA (adenine1618-N6)-methyltransferase